MAERLVETIRISRREFLESRGLTETGVEEVLDKLPFLPPVDTMEGSLDKLENRGIAREQVNGMVVKQPSILGYTAERTNALLDNLENRGIAREQVNGMVVKLPSILSCTAGHTNALLDNLETRGIPRAS